MLPGNKFEEKYFLSIHKSLIMKIKLAEGR